MAEKPDELKELERLSRQISGITLPVVTGKTFVIVFNSLLPQDIIEDYNGKQTTRMGWNVYFDRAYDNPQYEHQWKTYQDDQNNAKKIIRFNDLKPGNYILSLTRNQGIELAAVLAENYPASLYEFVRIGSGKGIKYLFQPSDGGN